MAFELVPESKRCNSRVVGGFCTLAYGEGCRSVLMVMLIVRGFIFGEVGITAASPALTPEITFHNI